MLVKNIASKIWIDALIKSEKNETKIERAKFLIDKGYLKKLIIEVGKISAIFQVPNEPPVKSEIMLKPLPDLQISKLESIFKKHPLFVSELLNGNVSQGFLNEVDESKIRLIPQSWREIECNCTSGEKIQPSRYVTSLLFAFANKINSDINQLFLFRGVDLDILLMQHSTLVAAEEEVEYQESMAQIKTEPVVETPKWDGSLNRLKIPSINFEKSPINDLILKLPELNKKNSSSNFYSTLIQLYSVSAFSLKEIYPVPEKDINKVEEIDIYFYQERKSTPLSARILIENPETLVDLGFVSETEEIKIEYPLLNNADKYVLKENKFSEFNFEDLQQFFNSIPLLVSEEAQPNIAFLSHIQSITMGLIKSWQFYPQLIRTETGAYQFIFKANTSNDKVLESIKHLKEIFPYNFYYFKEGNEILNTDGVEDLLSMFLTHFIVERGNEFDVENLELGIFEQHLISGKVFISSSMEDQIFSKDLTTNLSYLWFENLPIKPEIYFDPINELELSATLYIADKADMDAGAFTLEEILSDRNHFAGLGNRQIKNILKDMLSKVENYYPGIENLINDKIIFKRDEYYNFIQKYTVLLNHLGISVHSADETLVLVIPQFGYIPEHLVLNDEIMSAEEVENADLFHEGNISYLPAVKVGKTTWISRVEFLSILSSNEEYTLYKGRMLNTKSSITEPILLSLEEGNIEVALIDSIYCYLIGHIDEFPIFDGKVIKETIDLITSTDLDDFINSHLKYQIGMIINSIDSAEVVYNHIQHYLIDEEMNFPILIVCASEEEKLSYSKSLKKDFKKLSILQVQDISKFAEGKKGVVLISKDDDLGSIQAQLEDAQFSSLLLLNAESISQWPVLFCNMLRNIYGVQKIVCTHSDIFKDLESLYIAMEIISPNYLPTPEEFQSVYSFEINTFRNEKSLSELKRICSPFFFENEVAV